MLERSHSLLLYYIIVQIVKLLFYKPLDPSLPFKHMMDLDRPDTNTEASVYTQKSDVEAGDTSTETGTGTGTHSGQC